MTNPKLLNDAADTIVLLYAERDAALARAEKAETDALKVVHTYAEANAALTRELAEALARAEKAEMQLISMSAVLEGWETGEWKARAEKAEAALEYARHKMWEYGFSEDDLQPIRAALKEQGQ